MTRNTNPILFWGILAGLTALPLITSSGAAFAQDRDYAWRYNSYGMPGLIDMPIANSRPDAELSSTLSFFRNQPRATLTFQISDRLSASFRYLRYLRRPEVTGLPAGSPPVEILDRNFSLHYRFMDEGYYMPALAVGMNDIGGTGHFGAEYIVATKTLRPNLRVTGGIGWGRLGSHGGFSNPLGALHSGLKTRPGRQGDQGGLLQVKSWFRGDAAFFGGIEWKLNERLQFTAEYSSDSYPLEHGASFERKSPINLGLSWRASPQTTLSGHYLYGSQFGFQVNFTLNPKSSAHGSGREAAPQPILARAQATGLTWGEIPNRQIPQGIADELSAQGIQLLGFEPNGSRLRVTIVNSRYSQSAQAVGRVARALSRHAPAEVGQFEIVLAKHGMPVTRVVMQRDEFEALEFHPVAPDLLRVSTQLYDHQNLEGLRPEAYPQFTWTLAPYALPSFFDPNSPLMVDFGVGLGAKLEPLPGLVFSARIQQRVAGNLNKATRGSDSKMTRVRSEAYRYYRATDTSLQHLTAAYYMRPGRDLFARVTAGYLEMMYAGVSTELLWKPQNSALALGVEINHLRQRAFNQGFGLQDYGVTSGHVSAYYEAGGGYQAQLDIGRYLAGDIGATITFGREFDNGWRISAFATKTNVSADTFGEGSFDKGIQLEIPMDWITGRPTQQKLTQVIRPVQRDGGARVIVPGRLYEGLRGLQASEINGSWGRVFR